MCIKFNKVIAGITVPQSFLNYILQSVTPPVSPPGYARNTQQFPCAAEASLTRSNKCPIQARTSSPKQRHINTQNIVRQIVVYRVKLEIYEIYVF